MQVFTKSKEYYLKEEFSTVDLLVLNSLLYNFFHLVAKQAGLKRRLIVQKLPFVSVFPATNIAIYNSFNSQ